MGVQRLVQIYNMHNNEDNEQADQLWLKESKQTQKSNCNSKFFTSNELGKSLFLHYKRYKRAFLGPLDTSKSGVRNLI